MSFTYAMRLAKSEFLFYFTIVSRIARRIYAKILFQRMISNAFIFTNNGTSVLRMTNDLLMIVIILPMIV